jgi:DNA-binding transcriptional regulator YdaS (Cro superfamily)
VDDALRQAISKYGGMRAMGRALGIAHQAISQWEKTPVLRVLEIERQTGISRSILRPDVYPPDQGGPPPPINRPI